MPDKVLYALAVITGFFIRILPVRFSLWLARRLGFIACIFYTKRRRIGYANMKAAFSSKMSPRQIKLLIRRTFQHFAQVLFEVFRFPAIDERYVDTYITCSGFDNIKDAVARCRGAIILTAHFGNWELSGLAGAIKGYPQDVIARQQKYPLLNDLLNSYRAVYGRRVFGKGMAIRDIISSLKENRVVAILSDQDGGANGCLVNFFGRLASTPQGASVFASKFESSILPNFCARTKGPHYNLTVEKPIEPTSDVQSTMQKFTDILQSYITRYPYQWLWLHKRWKTTPSRRILIISDGKAGHLNQAKAVAKQLKRAVFERAERDERVKQLKIENLEDLIYQEKLIEIKFKNRLHKIILTICSLFASPKCQGCLKCLEFCLTKDSYNDLASTYADIIISCGSQTAAVNRILSFENLAKNITVMKPGILPASQFNLCIMPRHDNPAPAPNTIITEGALNMARQRAGAPVRQSIGLLIGGNTKDFILDEENIKKILDEVIKISISENLDIFATTSRRTPLGVENIVKDRLSSLANCKLLVIANEKNIPDAVNKILSSSSIALVSGESISMISEAASSGRKTIVFKLKTRKQNSKHLRFLENLKEKGYIVLCDPGRVFDALMQALKDASPVKKLDDSALVYEAVKKLI